MAADFHDLLIAHLPNGFALVCQARHLAQEIDGTGRAAVLAEPRRFTFCIGATGSSAHLHYVLEVQRGHSLKSVVDADLRRLLAAKAAVPEARAFLLLLCEGAMPRRFVTAHTFAVRNKVRIPKSDGHCYVRALLSAGATGKSHRATHCACAIEVLPNVATHR